MRAVRANCRVFQQLESQLRQHLPPLRLLSSPANHRRTLAGLHGHGGYLGTWIHFTGELELIGLLRLALQSRVDLPRHRVRPQRPLEEENVRFRPAKHGTRIRAQGRCWVLAPVSHRPRHRWSPQPSSVLTYSIVRTSETCTGFSSMTRAPVTSVGGWSVSPASFIRMTHSIPAESCPGSNQTRSARIVSTDPTVNCICAPGSMRQFHPEHELSIASYAGTSAQTRR